ncbi:cytochrome P450 [Hamadaea tsunoensis]|uniref:cytochrome P450 n=1 Tax=Hamadaea tsunoensis TaxID=53368 RepID=UPI00040F1E4F|nr:cytochrome P450 [Hamadaea tsunoensis]
MTTNAPRATARPLPLLGHALHLLRDPFTFLCAARDQAPVVRIRIGPGDAYVVSSPALIRQILTADARRYEKGVQFDKLRPIIGNGLVTAGGEEHLRHRRLVQPAFHHTRIEAYARTMRTVAEEATAAWENADIDLNAELARITLRIVAKTMFSTDLGDEVVAEVVRSMPTVLSGITKRALSPFAFLEKLPTAENRAFAAANARLRSVVDRIIAEYRRHGADQGDMVSMLLLARDEETGAGLSDEQVRDEVITMLLAGTETTANLLAWVLHVLGGRPDLESRLHDEVDAALGEDEEITVETIGRLAYARRLITETLRLYPPAWLITRRTLGEVDLGEVRLPAGASVLFSPYAVHRDPTVYADPDVFDPDRWLGPAVPRVSFIPFGAGNRQCVGEGFAWTEALVVLATIARRYRLRPVPGVAVRMTASATLTPSALPMTVHPRVRSLPVYA